METMERLVDLEITKYGTILEQLEIVYPMTGFRLRLLVEHLGPTGPTAPSILSQGSEAEQGAPRRFPNKGKQTGTPLRPSQDTRLVTVGLLPF